jgi:hypothetical protein
MKQECQLIILPSARQFTLITKKQTILRQQEQQQVNHQCQSSILPTALTSDEVKQTQNELLVELADKAILNGGKTWGLNYHFCEHGSICGEKTLKEQRYYMFLCNSKTQYKCRHQVAVS